MLKQIGMNYDRTTSLRSGPRGLLSLFFSLWCLLLINFACKKSCLENEIPKIPDKPMQLPRGNPIGEMVTARIGDQGGSITSKDGTIKIEIPAGAVHTTATFSIQEVENVLNNKGKAFRLLPENFTFKKPVVLTYNYGNMSPDGLNPDFLFLAYHDGDGYFYSANKTRGNRQKQTLSVTTIRFGDWTFYAPYALHFPDHNPENGELRLGEGEEAVIGLKVALPDRYDTEYARIHLPDIGHSRTSEKVAWSYTPEKGTLTSNPGLASVTYKAPAKVNSTEKIYVNVTITGNLETDNQGNRVQQIQIRQPVVIHPEGYFIVTEDGVEMAASEFFGDYFQVTGSQLVAYFPNGYILLCYAYGNTGSFPYNRHDTPGSALMELSQNGREGMMVYRPKVCDKDTTRVFSPGTFNMKTVAQKAGEYFEGDFSVTLYGFDYCRKGRTKNLSGRFRFRKT